MKLTKKHIYWFLTGLLFLLFFITRLFRILAIPRGLHIDEAAMAYDAWSLANYGVDRHLTSWPVYLVNFGRGQSALYCYLCAGLFKLFGYHPLLIRMPAVLFSFLTLLFGMLLVKKLHPEKYWLALLTGTLIIICPYFVLASRFGLDCNLMLGMSTVFLYCFTCAIESGQYRWYILSGFTGGLVLYTYAISYLALPLFLLLSFIYIIWTKKFSFTHWVSMAIPMGILAFPLLLEQYINAFDLEEIRLGIFTVTKMETYRASEVGLVTWNNFMSTLESTFVKDSSDLTYNSVPGIFNLYYATIPLALIGLVHELYIFGKKIKQRVFLSEVHMLLWFLSMLLVGSSITSVNSNKINGIFFAVIFLAVQGVFVLAERGKKYVKLLPILCGILYCVEFIRFGTYYYRGGYLADNYPLPFFDITVSEAVEFLKDNPQHQHVKTFMAEPPVYFAISIRLSPYEILMDEWQYEFSEYWHCSGLPEIVEEYNYIVHDRYVDYMNSLRESGFTEINYGGYSLFYME